jgi:hypothetical protein
MIHSNPKRRFKQVRTEMLAGPLINQAFYE